MKPRITVGFYGWWSLTGDWRKLIDMLIRCGVSGMRIFGQYAWPEGRGTYTPFSLLKNLEKIDQFPWNPPKSNEEPRRGRYFFKDGFVRFRHREYPGIDLPVYDLDSLDESYFIHLDELLAFCVDRNFKITYELEDWCSLKHGGIEKYRHPYFVSPQAHSAATPGGLFGVKLKPYMKNYWKAVTNVFRRHSLYGDLSMMNEYDFTLPDDGNVYTPEQEKGLMLHWYSEAMGSIEAIGSLFSWTGSTTDSPRHRYHKEILDLAGRYSIHGIGNKDSYNYNIGLLEKSGIDVKKHSYRISFSGDGFATGSAKPDFRGRRGITIKEVPWLCKALRDGEFELYEALVRYHGGHARGTFEEFDQAYGGYGIMREFGKRLDLLPPPPPEPPPTPPTPEPPLPPSPPAERPCSYYLKRLNFRRWWKCIWRKI